MKQKKIEETKRRSQEVKHERRIRKKVNGCSYVFPSSCFFLHPLLLVWSEAFLPFPFFSSFFFLLSLIKLHPLCLAVFSFSSSFSNLPAASLFVSRTTDLPTQSSNQTGVTPSFSYLSYLSYPGCPTTYSLLPRALLLLLLTHPSRPSSSSPYLPTTTTTTRRDDARLHGCTERGLWKFSLRR